MAVPNIAVNGLRQLHSPGITTITPPQKRVADVSCIDLLVAGNITLGPHHREAKRVVLVRLIIQIPVHVHSLHGYSQPGALRNMSTVW